jgi:tetratricopeptide (TPR) repeat protein
VTLKLFEGVGNVLAGDTVGGARTLRDLASPSQPNLSFRWLALYWSARAAMGGSGLEAARLLVKDALELSRQLDVEARGVSQLIAAELLARAGENDKARAWLAESRSRFDRSKDAWGMGRTWLAEARVWAAEGNDAEAVAAARRARDTDPAWDGPPLFLAARSLTQGDLNGADGILAELRTPAADRLRKLVEAVRQGSISQADATEFLRLHLATPSTQGLRTLERIANAAPKFLQVREALAWMLVKLGKYAAARETFSWLLTQPLGPGDRALVMLGLSCIASATRSGDKGAEPAAGPAAAGDEAKPPPRLSESVLAPRASQPGFSGLDAVFSGRLSVFSLPDLVEFLRSARRTGVLVCSSPGGMGSLRFREGWIAGASSPATPGVAELLFRAGKLSSDDLRKVSEGLENPPSDALIGEQLVRQGLADAPAVEQVLREQIELTLRELVKWSDGEFAFSREEGEEAAPGMPAVRVDAQELLLTLFKEMDESSRDLASSDVEV